MEVGIVVGIIGGSSRGTESKSCISMEGALLGIEELNAVASVQTGDDMAVSQHDKPNRYFLITVGIHLYARQCYSE